MGGGRLETIIDKGLSAQPCGCDLGSHYKAPSCKAHVLINGRLREVGPPYEPRVLEPSCTCQTHPELVCGYHSVQQATTTERLKAAHPEDRKRWRKERPLHTGVLAYFPDAIMEVAHVSWLGNEQHNPGQPLHWSREKSADHTDCAARHLTDHSLNPLDDDGGYHLAKAAWRSLAALQLYLEKQKEQA
jgi:hypothetical protein